MRTRTMLAVLAVLVMIVAAVAYAQMAPGPGGPGGQPGLMRMSVPFPTVMLADEGDLYILRGNEVFRVRKGPLKVVDSMTLPQPQPPKPPADQ